MPPLYDCSKCPAYCCTYDEISVTERDIRRLAKHFELEPDVARKRFTKLAKGTSVLRHQKDAVFGSACMFLDLETRRCTVYEARPGVCHEYPDQPHCGYYDFLKWERGHQDDPEFIPLENRIG
jgi:uncharacterized protein